MYGPDLDTRVRHNPADLLDVEEKGQRKGACSLTTLNDFNRLGRALVVANDRLELIATRYAGPGSSASPARGLVQNEYDIQFVPEIGTWELLGERGARGDSGEDGL